LIYEHVAKRRAKLHELSLAQNVVDSVSAEVQRKSAKRVVELEVGLGELMQLDRRAFRFGLKLLMTSPELRQARVRVKSIRATFACRRCDSRWNMTEARKQLDQIPDRLRIREPDSKEVPLHFLPLLYPAFIHCPHCGSRDILVQQGKEIQLTKLVLEE
jgi:hydrogenase nickel incorporation protein HypA/HybF